MQLEIARQKIPEGGQGKASKELTDIGRPTIDWVALAQGMGVHHAVRSSTCEELQCALESALAYRGPSLIECVI